MKDYSNNMSIKVLSKVIRKNLDAYIIYNKIYKMALFQIVVIIDK